MQKCFKPAALVSALCALVLSQACAPKPIKVGVPVVLTGLSSRIGQDGRNGALMAAAEINAAGGIKGRPLEVLVRDDKDDADTAVLVDKELASQGVVALVGHMASRAGLKAKSLTAELKLPLISPTISSTDYSGQDDYFFRIIGSNDLMGRTIASWAWAKGYRRASAAYESTNASYTIPFFKGFKEEFEAKGGLVYPPHTFATAAEYDYKGLVDSVLKEKPEVLFTVASPFDTGSMCQALSKRGSALPVLACMWAMTDDLFRFGGRSVDRLTGVMYLDSEDQSPAFLGFKERYKARYGDAPSFASVYGYDAMMVLAASLKKAKALDGPSIKEALLGIGTFPGLQEAIHLDGFGDCDKKPKVFSAQGGSFHKAD